MILGKPLADWRAKYPLLEELIALRGTSCFNPVVATVEEALGDVGTSSAQPAISTCRSTSSVRAWASGLRRTCSPRASVEEGQATCLWHDRGRVRQRPQRGGGAGGVSPKVIRVATSSMTKIPGTPVHCLFVEPTPFTVHAARHAHRPT